MVYFPTEVCTGGLYLMMLEHLQKKSPLLLKGVLQAHVNSE